MIPPTRETGVSGFNYYCATIEIDHAGLLFRLSNRLLLAPVGLLSAARLIHTLFSLVSATLLAITCVGWDTRPALEGPKTTQTAAQPRSTQDDVIV